MVFKLNTNFNIVGHDSRLIFYYIYTYTLCISFEVHTKCPRSTIINFTSTKCPSYALSMFGRSDIINIKYYIQYTYYYNN